MTPLTPTEIHRISSVFVQLLETHQAQLQKSALARIDRAGSQLAQDRSVWLEESSHEAIKLIAGFAKTFNNDHPDARITTDDLVDVLARAIVLIQLASENDS